MNSKADQYVADCSSEKCKERFEKFQEDRKKAKGIYEQQLTDIKAYIGWINFKKIFFLNNTYKNL